MQRKLENELNSKLALAQSLNFSMMDIGETKASSGFGKIIKIVNGYAFDDTGNMSEEDAQLYVSLAENHGDAVVVSPVTFNEGQPTITFSVKRLDESVDFFVFNLSAFSQMMTDYATEGSFAELMANGNVIFSDKHGKPHAHYSSNQFCWTRLAVDWLHRFNRDSSQYRSAKLENYPRAFNLCLRHYCCQQDYAARFI